MLLYSRGAAHNICNLKQSVPQRIAIVLHNGSNYDYHFIIKELTEELKKNHLFKRKHWKITVPIEKLRRNY